MTGHRYHELSSTTMLPQSRVLKLRLAGTSSCSQEAQLVPGPQGELA